MSERFTELDAAFAAGTAEVTFAGPGAGTGTAAGAGTGAGAGTAAATGAGLATGNGLVAGSGTTAAAGRLGIGDDVADEDVRFGRSSPADVFAGALLHMVKVGASDLHVKAGSRPLVRVEGQLRPCPLRVVDAEDCEAIVAGSIPAGHAEAFHLRHEADYALPVSGLGRFRVNAFRERGRAALAVRMVVATVPDAATLGLLPAVQQLAACDGGLVLLAGRVGSGKSTTMAWLVDRINETRAANIVTIEDPIEYVHTDKRSIVHQREVGTDTVTHAEALRRLLRQDPDVVVLGEIRDEDTAWTALTAAQTGHLVLATLHTDTAGESIDRLIELIPAPRQHQARLSLAATLRAVVCQRLVASAAEGRRVLAQEVLVSTGRIAERIVDPVGAGPTIADLVADGDYLGMIGFDQHLAALHRAGTLTRSEAVAAATNAHDLAVALAARHPAPSA